jgi:hypothetical protein
MLLNLHLGLGELLVELLEIVFGVEHLAVFCDLLERVRHYLVEPLGLLD